MTQIEEIKEDVSSISRLFSDTLDSVQIDPNRGSTGAR